MDIRQLAREIIEEVSLSDYLTPEIIGEKLKLSPTTIRRKCRIGEIPSTKFGRSVRVKTTDFEQYCKDHEL